MFFNCNPLLLDADMAEQAEITHETDEERENRERPFWKQHRLFHASFAQFCYTGAQGMCIFTILFHPCLTLGNIVAIAGYFINYVTEIRPGTNSALGAKFLAAAQGCFAVGRFSGSGAPLQLPMAYNVDVATYSRHEVYPTSYHISRLPLRRNCIQRCQYNAARKHRPRNANDHAVLRERVLPHDCRSGY